MKLFVLLLGVLLCSSVAEKEESSDGEIENCCFHGNESDAAGFSSVAECWNAALEKSTTAVIYLATEIECNTCKDVDDKKPCKLSSVEVSMTVMGVDAESEHVNNLERPTWVINSVHELSVEKCTLLNIDVKSYTKEGMLSFGGESKNVTVERVNFHGSGGTMIGFKSGRLDIHWTYFRNANLALKGSELRATFNRVTITGGTVETTGENIEATFTSCHFVTEQKAYVKAEMCGNSSLSFDDCVTTFTSNLSEPLIEVSMCDEEVFHGNTPTVSITGNTFKLSPPRNTQIVTSFKGPLVRLLPNKNGPIGTVANNNFSEVEFPEDRMVDGGIFQVKQKYVKPSDVDKFVLKRVYNNVFHQKYYGKRDTIARFSCSRADTYNEIDNWPVFEIIAPDDHKSNNGETEDVNCAALLAVAPIGGYRFSELQPLRKREDGRASTDEDFNLNRKNFGSFMSSGEKWTRLVEDHSRFYAFLLKYTLWHAPPTESTLVLATTQHGDLLRKLDSQLNAHAIKKYKEIATNYMQHNTYTKHIKTKTTMEDVYDACDRKGRSSFAIKDARTSWCIPSFGGNETMFFVYDDAERSSYSHEQVYMSYNPLDKLLEIEKVRMSMMLFFDKRISTPTANMTILFAASHACRTLSVSLTTAAVLMMMVVLSH